MKRVISTLEWIEPKTFKDRGYLLTRYGNPYSIIETSSDPNVPDPVTAHRSAAKDKAKTNTSKNKPNMDYIEMNNYAEDYVWDQKYPDIPESYKYKNVATNTGLVLIFYTDSDPKKLIIYDLLVDNADAKSDDYKVKSIAYPRDKTETRRYSIVGGKFVMNALFKDSYGYYGIIDSMKTINVTNTYMNNTYTKPEFIEAIGYLKHANMNNNVINQGFTFSTERTFDYIILPSKKYFRTSGNVTIYGPNANSVVCLNKNGIETTDTTGQFWYVKEPFYASDGMGYIILKYAGNDSCILEVS